MSLVDLSIQPERASLKIRQTRTCIKSSKRAPIVGACYRSAKGHSLICFHIWSRTAYMYVYEMAMFTVDRYNLG